MFAWWLWGLWRTADPFPWRSRAAWVHGGCYFCSHQSSTRGQKQETQLLGKRIFECLPTHSQQKTYERDIKLSLMAQLHGISLPIPLKDCKEEVCRAVWTYLSTQQVCVVFSQTWFLNGLKSIELMKFEILP